MLYGLYISVTTSKMSNLVILSLESERDGSISGRLSYNFEPLLHTYYPAKVNEVMKEKNCTSLVFVGKDDVVRCSFPLTVQDLIAILARVRNSAEARFVERLDGEYSTFSDVSAAVGLLTAKPHGVNC